jgi:ChrB-like protein
MASELAIAVTAVTLATMAQPTWILLSSRLPREPTRLRLSIWRRLKRIGAVLLHDSVWVLPADAKTREAFEWLAEEIEEQGGTALTWEALSLSVEQDRRIVQQFRAEADERYAGLAASATEIRRAALGPRKKRWPTQIGQAVRQLRGLERALRLERRRDYFRAPGRGAAAAAVQEAVQDLERCLAPTEGVCDALGH